LQAGATGLTIGNGHHLLADSERDDPFGSGGKPSPWPTPRSPAHPLLRGEHPYRLPRDIRGIGFKTADAIATRLGIEKTAMVRGRAGISYALTDAMGEGHCGLPTEELIRSANGPSSLSQRHTGSEPSAGTSSRRFSDSSLRTTLRAVAPIRLADAAVVALRGRRQDDQLVVGEFHGILRRVGDGNERRHRQSPAEAKWRWRGTEVARAFRLSRYG
jgi:hypothetical protein